jgi:two-component system sensor histidine kinase QseC
MLVRLLATLLAAVLVAGLVTGWAGYRRAMHEADEMFDAQLAQNAQLLLALTAGAHDDDEVELDGHAWHPYQRKFLFQVWETGEEGDDGRGAPRLALHSAGAPRAWPEGAADRGFSMAEVAGRPWRFFALAGEGDDDHRRIVLAAQELSIREELARQVALSNLMPYLLGLPLLALALVLLARQGLVPLRRLADSVQARAPEHLDPLPEADLPDELRPLAGSMNRLFERMARTLARERRFTSDAAHELRTPLAALRAQLQVAERTPDAAERGQAIAKALHGADRMTHLVAQLLALARLEGGAVEPPSAPVDLAALLAEQLAEFAGPAERRGVTVEGEVAAAVRVPGNPELLRALIRNLLDNALRYGAEGGRLAASLTASEGAAVLRVADAGPGLTPAERAELGRPFRRLRPEAAEGAGLGLSIVGRIAELHQARLSYGEGLDGRGLGVELTFPPPTAQSGQ